ncbi:MAG: DUF4272 domain-containing protein [Clostridia bacterium]|nr:DUF4272 domain-containing protein [Clostridia bacterium]
MNIFKKLFRRRKNTIHMSPEEAYATDALREEEPKADAPSGALLADGADRNEPSPVEEDAQRPETAQNAQEEKDAPGAEEAEAGSSDDAAEETPEARTPLKEIRSRVYCSLPAPDAAREPLRLMLRDAASGFCEDEYGFRAALADGCEAKVSISAAGEDAFSDLANALGEDLQETVARIVSFLPSLNARVDIDVLAADEEPARAFSERTARCLNGYYSMDGQALYGPEGKRLLTQSGETDYETFGLSSEREGEDAVWAEETPEDAPDDVPKDAPEDAVAEEPADPAPAQDEQEAKQEDPGDADDPVALRRRKSEKMIREHGIALGYSTAANLSRDALILPAPGEIIQRACALMYVSRAARLSRAGNDIAVAGRNTGLLARLDERYDVRSEFTAKENAYLRGNSNESPTSFAARCEGSALLMWALGLFDIDWPSDVCDTAALGSLFRDNDLASLTRRAHLLSADKLLDMYDLTTRLHSVCVHASRRELREMPIDPEIIYERHYALNWLLGVGGRVAWDKVIPST